MKKITSLFILLSLSVTVYAQEEIGKMNFELGKGLNVQMNKGKHNFKIGGYIQLDGIHSKLENEKASTQFGVRRSQLNLGGDFFDKKFSFFLQMDFTDSYPLLDAWMAYHLTQNTKISVGQKLSFSGTRSLMYSATALSFGDHGLSNKTFYASGRELGVFFETRNRIGNIGTDIGLALTSGDGRNSFGSNSKDYDIGGYKYSARASLYPLGFFTKKNDLVAPDFAREETLKMAIGSAFSYNVGASHKIGEGHGNFVTYNKEGKHHYPNYQKIAIDVLMKYKGFHLLGEYINAVGGNLDNIYTNSHTSSKLKPKQIADYLVLGEGFNVEAGYMLSSTLGFEFRYSKVMPEWEENKKLIENKTEITGGITKYFIDNRLKMQFVTSYMDMPNNTLNKNKWFAGVVAHVVF